MRRRARIDLGQATNAKEEAVLERKRQRWLATNKDKPQENPFLKAVRPDQEHYGAPDESEIELRSRLDNLEFGNFPGYFNYRNKAAQSSKLPSDPNKCDPEEKGDNDANQLHINQSTATNKKQKSDDVANSNEEASSPLDSGLSDERLAYLKKEWFEGKDVLDIGCNRGHITYAIARLFAPKSIVGIDIDLKMVNMANRDLHLHLEDCILRKAREFRLQRAAKLSLEGSGGNITSSYIEDPKQFPLFSYISTGPLNISSSPRTTKEEEEKSEAAKPESGDGLSHQMSEANCEFPNNLVFVEHNYVLATDELVEKQRPHFDTIVCLSVTKWVHLNYRDDGLRRFFKRIYKHLRPDGLLILEAQPYDNYGRRKRLSERLRANYYSIRFKPDEFDEYLLSEQVGFRKMVHSTVTEHECIGFKRPLKVYLK